MQQFCCDFTIWALIKFGVPPVSVEKTNRCMIVSFVPNVILTLYVLLEKQAKLFVGILQFQFPAL